MRFKKGDTVRIEPRMINWADYDRSLGVVLGFSTSAFGFTHEVVIAWIVDGAGRYRLAQYQLPADLQLYERAI